MVRCKFKVISIQSTEGSRDKRDADGNPVMQEGKNWAEREPCEMRTVKMSPVYSENPQHENKAFWDATPSGSLELSSVNLDAVAQLTLGDEFYIDIHKAPPNDAD